MKTIVVKVGQESESYEDCHAVIDSDGDLTIANLADEVVDQYHKHDWIYVTTYA